MKPENIAVYILLILLMFGDILVSKYKKKND